MNGKGPLSRGSGFLIVLLTLSVAVNGAQAVVLCTGSDGHVAVELAGHRHCHSAHDSQEAPHEAGDGADERDTSCRPCVDIPLSPAISDGPVVQKAPETNALSASIAQSIPDMADHGLGAYATAGACPAFTSFYDPISSIILIV